MASWLPQNIQKRLLLYVVQQISLFSNVDISNLDVSLGSSSQFSFHDLDLDVEDIHIPNAAVRSGYIKNLDLQLTVSGGVDIKGEGLEFVVKPTLGGTSDPGGFSLVRSVFDLTNSVMQPIDTEKQEEDDAAAEEGSSSGSEYMDADPANTSAKFSSTSALEAMRNKALEIALSKLSITLKNASFKFLFSSHNCIELQIEEIHFLTADDHREIKLTTLEILHSKPEDQDYDEAFTEESDLLASSLVYTKAEATSIYMSAMQSAPEVSGPPEPDKLHETSDPLVKLTNLNISFRGLTSVEDLSVRDLAVGIDVLTVDMEELLKLNDPVLETVIKIISSRTSLAANKLPISDKKSAQGLQNYKRFQQEQNIEEDIPITELNIGRLHVRVSSDVQLLLHGIILTNNISSLVSVSARSIEILDGTKTILTTTATKEPLLYFLFKSSEKETCIFITQELSIDLTEDSICNIATFFFNLQACLKSWSKFTSNSSTHSSKAPAITCKSEAISILLRIADYQLQLTVDPVSISLPLTPLSVARFKISMVKNHEKTVLLDAENIKLEQLLTSHQFSTFDHNQNETYISTKTTGDIESIIINASQTDMTSISRDIQHLVSKLLPHFSPGEAPKSSTSGDKRYKHLKKSVRILNSSSIIYKQSSLANFAIRIKHIKGTMKELLCPSFGNLVLKLADSTFISNKNGSFTFYSKDLSLARFASGKNHQLISLIKKNDQSRPAMMIQKRPSGKVSICFRNTVFYYYATLLPIFDEMKNDDARKSTTKNVPTKNENIEIKLTDCTISLSPFRLNAVLMVVIGRAVFDLQVPEISVKGTIKASTLMLIDDKAHIKREEQEPWLTVQNFYSKSGFANIGKIDTVSLLIQKRETGTQLDIEIDYASLSLCADSTHTLVQVCIDLKPPVSFPDERKYRTRVSPVDTFHDVDLSYFDPDLLEEKKAINEPAMEIVDDFLDQAPQILSEHRYSNSTSANSSPLNEHNSFNLQESHFANRKWLERELHNAFDDIINIQVNLHLKKAIIKLYDGYDWKYTRKSISNIIDRMESEMQMQINEENEENKIEATIFESIYISAPKNSGDGADLKRLVNEEIHNDPGIRVGNSVKKLKLRPSKHHKILVDISSLKAHFSGYTVDEPTESESDNSTDILNDVSVSIQDFEIIDNVPTSTWNKFVAILREESRPRETPMLKLDLKTVRPIDFLEATELRLGVNVLPLRLHVDQDTLDFLTRFGEFKDKRFELIDEYPDVIYIQRFEINSIKVKLDYKPKKVDYAGIKSGHTSEFMNFFILDGSKMTMKHVILYGVNGFPELGKHLNSIWMPDITGTQLPGVLSGLAPVKSLVALGSGVKALVTVPVKEYKQDQRLARSLQKGAQVFLKTTTGEFVRLGVKLASGTQAVLENTEHFFGGRGPGARGVEVRVVDTGEEIDAIVDESMLKPESLLGGHNPKKGTPAALIIEPSDEDEGSPKIISLYADQPLTAQKGLQEAYGSFEKNVYLAYDAVRKARNEIKEGNTAQGTATSIARATPVAILRPLIGATEAFSKTLQGISNQLDEEQALYIQDKYKSKNPKK